MTTEEQTLWTRIETFRFDDPDATFAFTARLARENGWTDIYTERVVGEYRKFIFLCCLTHSGVTPSDAVDQAWHLHLTFTQSYWVDLCRNTLGREIHHNPTKGGRQEAQKFDGFYTDTHDLYRVTFGTEPPDDIWPGNQMRFADIDFRRVNLRTNWVVPKPSFPVYGVVALVGIMVVVMLFLRAASARAIEFWMTAVIFLGCISLVPVVASLGKLSPENRRTGRDFDGGDGDVSFLFGGDGHGDSGGDSGCSGSGCSGCGGGCGGGD